MKDSGMSFDKIGDALGFNREKIWRSYYNATGKQPKSPRAVKNSQQQVLELRKKGLTFQQIATELSMSTPNAWHLFKRVKQEVDPILCLPANRRYLLKAKDAQELRKQGKLQRQIANELGITVKNVRTLLHLKIDNGE
jgi:hypothetical protein